MTIPPLPPPPPPARPPTQPRQPMQPSPGFNFLSPEPAPPRFTRRIIILTAVGIVLIAALATGIALSANKARASKSFELTGTITLTDSIAGYSSDSEFECQGKGGYSDIGPATSVTVADEAGTLIAKGRLVSSIGDSQFCGLIFAVPDVPTGKKYYQVEVSHRGVLSYTEAEAAEGIGLSLGD